MSQSLDIAPNLLLGLIVACELGFWIVICAGLVSRYLLGWRRLGAVLLWSVPLIDLVLLAATIIDLRSGAIATWAHGLAAAYVGFSLAFGAPTIRWADRWFAYRFASGPKPAKAPQYGWGNMLYELKLWLRCILACSVIYALLLLVIALVGDAEKTQELADWLEAPSGMVFLWFVFGPLWSLVFRWGRSEHPGTPNPSSAKPPKAGPVPESLD